MSSSKNNPGELQTIKQPKNVKVLILTENKTNLKQFYHIRNCINLIKIDLSYNKLIAFPPGFTFISFPKLRTLFLHYNKFSIIKNLMPVTECPNLLYFTLFGNPLEETKTRHFFVNQMPRLMLMDNKIVKLEERNPDLNIKQTESKAVTFPLFKQSNKLDTSIYLQNVIKELAQVRKLFIIANPIIKIQRWWKHFYRLKHRKWKITKLPSESRLYTPHDIKQYKNDLQRLVTQKIEVGKTQQDKVSAIIKQNGQFWLYFRELVSQSQIYLTRNYCLQNNIPFSQNKNLLIYRDFGYIKSEQINSKRQLLFFIALHNRIIGHISNLKSNVILINDSKTKSKSSHIKINKQKITQTDQKLEKLYLTYHSYVKPQISLHQILAKVKKQYFGFVKSALNNESNPKFPFLSIKLLQRCLAAVTIQKCWRGAKIRKSVNCTKSIKQSKAALKIQRWIRSLKFQHRYKFLLEVSSYLKREKNSNQIILEIGQIPAIQQYCLFKQQLGKNFLINFQQCTFSVINPLNLSPLTKCKIIFHSERNPYPNYLNLTFKSEPKKTNAQNIKPKGSNVLQILFKQAFLINSFIDKNGNKLIKFTYRSQQQALNRKFILALKTYRMINHQFITSVNCLKFPMPYIIITNYLDVVNQNKMVSIIDEKQQQQIDNQYSQVKRISPQKSYQSLHSDFNMLGAVIYIKIKFYIVTSNYSCTVVLKSPNYNVSKSQTNLQKYYISRKRSLSKRYQPQLQQNFSKISRNILSLDQFEERKQQDHKPVFYQQILNTDQSHSIIDSLSPQNSTKNLEIYHKLANFDRFNRQVYPATAHITEGESKIKIQHDQRQLLRYKKELISEIKYSHRQKINQIVSKKQKQMNHLRQLISKEQEENDRKIEQSRQYLQQQKLKKHKFIKDKVRFNSAHFEEQFMKKGIKSIRKDMRHIQKLCKSSRQNHPSQEMQQISKSVKKQKYQSLKTEIKQFTIKFTDGDMSIKVTETGKQVQKSEQNKDFPLPIKKSMQRYQSPPQTFKSNRSESLTLMKDQIKDSHVINEKEQKERKKLRKKRLVHSVFPEEFYPLMQSNQIGFELPRISKM